MYFGYVRYNQLNDESYKNITIPILKYSLSRNFNKLMLFSEEIHNTISSSLNISNNSYTEELFNKIKSLQFKCDTVSLKKSIFQEFKKNGKYYLV